MAWLNAHGERRQNPRFPVRLALDYSETPGVLRGALVQDISEVGLRILSIHPIQIGAELKIRVYVSREEFSFDSIEGRGKIIWKRLHQEAEWKGFLYGLQVTEMAPADRERLRKLLPLEQKGDPSIARRVQ
jgi:hypothetical protein